DFKGEERPKQCIKLLEAVRTPIYPGEFHQMQIQNLIMPKTRIPMGKRVLALEQGYKQKNKNHHQVFVRFLLDNPHTFFYKKQALISSAQMEARVDAVFASYQPDPGNSKMDYRYFVEKLVRHYTDKKPEHYTRIYRKYRQYINQGMFVDWMNRTGGKLFASEYAKIKQGKSFNWITNLDYQILSWIAAKKRLAAVKNLLYSLPRGYDTNHINSKYFNNKQISPEEKLNFLKGFISYAGASKHTQRHIEYLKGTFAKHPIYKQIVEMQTNKVAAKDPLVANVNRLMAYKGNNNNKKEIHDLVKSIQKQYGKNAPGWEHTKNSRDMLIMQAYDKHFSLSWNKREGIKECLKIWTKKIDASGSWNKLINRPREHGLGADPLISKDLFSEFKRLVQAGKSFPYHVWHVWRYTTVDMAYIIKNSGEKVSTSDSRNFLWSYWQVRHHMRPKMGEYYTSFNTISKTLNYNYSYNHAREIIHELYHHPRKESLVELLPKTQAIYIDYVTKRKQFDPDTLSFLVGVYSRLGDKAGQIAQLKALDNGVLKTYSDAQQLLFWYYCQNSNFIPDDSNDSIKPWHQRWVLLN
ncbi:MAG: hypothetical protein HRT89_14180, partial [Lentisphaeria bacterium]|nr:hypothetical protein [Lentisphaeria bacterium]